MKEMQETKRWPIDFESLEKGDVIGVEKLEKITGKVNGTQAYAFAILGLCQYIQNGMDNLNKPVTCKIDKGRIRILTDSEASDYLDHRDEQNRSEQKRIVRHSLNVDQGNLNDEQKSVHLQRIRKQSLELQGRMLGFKNKLPRLAEKDNRPRLA
jgi:hypothetical protein